MMPVQDADVAAVFLEIDDLLELNAHPEHLDLLASGCMAAEAEGGQWPWQL